jgi:dsDNA-specific endonuclease/ATPase MutS2
MVCPEIYENGSMEFFRARHPLLEHACRCREKEGADPAEVVPIDVRLGSDFDILIITGSNTGGKTVTLKTVALLVIMAQSGLHLPVQRGARLPIFRDVLIEIGDEQSLEQSLSTFGGHVERLKSIFGRVRKNTLVLLDELGSGTDPDEGGAIGQAILDELRRVGCLAMVTTHFSILKAYALNHERVEVASVEFDTRTLRPTYHLHIGSAGESHAIAVASHLGLHKRIVESARLHLGRKGGQFRKALRRTGAARREAEVARAEAVAAELEAQTQAEKLQERMADIDRFKKEFATWLARLSELKPGDEVFVPSAKTTGRLARLETHRQIAVVDMGSIQREVSLTELMPDLGQEEARAHVASLRQSAGEQADQAAAQRVEAERLRKEARRLEQHQKEKARQFDAWLGAIARVKVGDEVSIAARPGHGKVVSVDFPGLKATVQVDGRELHLSLQDLFPQVGPFASKHHGRDRDRGRRKRHEKTGPQVDRNRPIQRRSAESKAAKRSREAVLATCPGEKIYVVPFRSAATLVRFDEKKEVAVVSRGAFEMQVPIADCEPVGYNEGK